MWKFCDCVTVVAKVLELVREDWWMDGGDDFSLGGNLGVNLGLAFGAFVLLFSFLFRFDK